MVTIPRYVAVDDCGNPVDPLLIEGQIHGGVALAIGQAQHEEAVYAEAGNLATGTFVDYTPPSAADLPSFITDLAVTPSTDNPLGAKGVGGVGTIGGTPANPEIVDQIRDQVQTAKKASGQVPEELSAAEAEEIEKFGSSG